MYTNYLRNSFDRFGAAYAAGVFGCLVLILVGLRPVLPVDETRYLSVAWEMWRGGSMLVPHLNGADYPDKPPLLFWLIDFVWFVFGDKSILVRLVAPAFAAISILLTARLYRSLWPTDRRGASLSSWILCTTALFLVFGTLTNFDTMLVTATLLCMLSLLHVRRSGNFRGWLGVAAAIAFGLLAKGPVILLHILPVALLMPLWADPELRPHHWYRGLALAVLAGIGIVGVWLVPALIVGGPAYGEEILWHQSVGRMVAAFDHQKPLWFYLLLLPAIIWPWGWSRNAFSGLSLQWLRGDEGLRFCATWFVGSFIALSLVGGKQIHYLLPELPAFALMVARAIGSVGSRDGTNASKQPWVTLLVPVSLIAIGAAMTSDTIIPTIGQHGLSLPPTSVIGAGLILVVLLVFIAYRRSATVSMAAIGAGTVLMAHVMLSPVLYRAYDPSVLALQLAKYEDNGIAIVKEKYDGEFTYAGELHQPLTMLPSYRDVREWAGMHPGGAVLTRDLLEQPNLTPIDSYNFRGRQYRLLEVPATSSNYASPSAPSGSATGSR